MKIPQHPPRGRRKRPNLSEGVASVPWHFLWPRRSKSCFAVDGWLGAEMRGYPAAGSRRAYPERRLEISRGRGASQAGREIGNVHRSNALLLASMSSLVRRALVRPVRGVDQTSSASCWCLSSRCDPGTSFARRPGGLLKELHPGASYNRKRGGWNRKGPADSQTESCPEWSG